MKKKYLEPIISVVFVETTDMLSNSPVICGICGEEKPCFCDQESGSGGVVGAARERYQETEFGSLW